MPSPTPSRRPEPAPFFADHRGARQHRFMESADINAAFRALFGPLRANIRRGMSIEGQVFALEMDPCIPGEMLGTEWIPPATRGIDNPALLADAGRRRAFMQRLLAEPRPESLLAYLCERGSARPGGGTHLYVEINAVDGCYAARFPIAPGRGWHRRELGRVLHQRIGPLLIA
ncbi:MAG: hypothetical protein LH480_04475 [Rubrivivax sp.]|nr:hypothetical protein [Rubrivivax sp.]